MIKWLKTSAIALRSLKARSETPQRLSAKTGTQSKHKHRGLWLGNTQANVIHHFKQLRKKAKEILRPGVQSICLLFVSWQSDFMLRYSKFHIWKYKVKVMAKVKPYGPIWGLKFNWYVCFLFRANRTIFGWNIANYILDLENWRSRSWPRSNPMIPFEA